MGDQTGLLSAERRTERVDRDGWIEEKMKEQDWSELGRGQAQEPAPFLVYQRILCFFPFFAFFISLTPAQYKASSFFFFCEKYRKKFSFPNQTATPIPFPFSFYRSFSTSRQPLLHFQPSHSTVTLQLCFRTIKSLLWAPHLSLFLLALN